MKSRKLYTLTFHCANGDVIPVAFDLENDRYTLKEIDYFTTRYSSEDELREGLNKLYREEFCEEPFQKENDRGYFIIEYKFDRGISRLNLVFDNIEELKEIIDHEKENDNLECNRVCKDRDFAARFSEFKNEVRMNSDFIDFYKNAKKDNNSYLVSLIENFDNLNTMCDQSGEIIKVEDKIKKTFSEYKTLRGVERCYKNYQLKEQGKEPLVDNGYLPYWELWMRDQELKDSKKEELIQDDEVSYAQLTLLDEPFEVERHKKR